MSENGVTTVNGKVIQCVFWNEDKHYGLYKIFSDNLLTEICLFSSKRLETGKYMTFSGQIAFERGRYMLKGARHENIQDSSLYKLYTEKKLRDRVHKSKQINMLNFQDILEKVLYKERKDTVEGIASALISGNSALNRNVESVPALKYCTFEELELRAQMRSIGLDDKLISKSLIPLLKQLHDNPSEDAVSILSQYTEAIQKDPYKLTEIFGISFNIVDECILCSGYIAWDDPLRKKAIILHTLSQLENNTGSTRFTEKAVMAAYPSFATMPPSIDMAFIRSCEDFHCEDGGVAKLDTYIGEREAFEYLTGLNSKPNVDKWQSSLCFGDATPEQLEAVESSAKERVSIITGGPGCGKTFTVNKLIKRLNSPGEDVILLAPTGKAAQRLSEVTNMPAATIHSFYGKIEKGSFSDFSEKGLSVIVDEASMISSESMLLLINALKKCKVKRLVFVGDTNQLPSVGAGNMLDDMIASGKFKTSRLTKIMRQDHMSSITQIAHGMLAGKHIEELSKTVDEDSVKDFYISTPRKGCQPIASIEKALESGSFKKFKSDFDPISDMQILCPVKRGYSGVFAMNIHLQGLLNPQTKDMPCILCGREDLKYTIHKGDKVLITKNHYKDDLVNGDVGIITDIGDDGATATIDVAGKGEVTVGRDVFPFVELGYAMTIHKSQGSEYPVVVTVLPEGNNPLYQRNLLYTAITRGSKLQWIIGKEETINKCIDTNIAVMRNTSFAKLLNSRDKEVATPRAEPLSIC